MLLTTFFLLFAPLLVSAQFAFFEQMFQGSGSSGGGAGRQQQERNVPSNSEWYKRMYNDASCNKYLCPGTLSCVDKPTHCPCAFEDTEEKFELHPDGLAVCVSKSGRDKSLTKRKVELARKGLL